MRLNHAFDSQCYWVGINGSNYRGPNRLRYWRRQSGWGNVTWWIFCAGAGYVGSSTLPATDNSDTARPVLLVSRLRTEETTNYRQNGKENKWVQGPLQHNFSKNIIGPATEIRERPCNFHQSTLVLTALMSETVFARHWRKPRRRVDWRRICVKTVNEHLAAVQAAQLSNQTLTWPTLWVTSLDLIKTTHEKLRR